MPIPIVKAPQVSYDTACVFCCQPTDTVAPCEGLEPVEQIPCCPTCAGDYSFDEFLTKEQWAEFRRALTRRQRVPIPYIGPWNDAPHKVLAAKGLCYRTSCGSVANHAWRNTGMGGARYCTHCVRLLNEGNPNLCIPDLDFALSMSIKAVPPPLELRAACVTAGKREFPILPLPEGGGE